MKSPVLLSDNILKDFEAHVISEYPKEACGLIREGKYVPCKNKATDPTKAFKIAPKDLVEPYTAIMHSHPYVLGDDSFKLKNNPGWASARDMEVFIQGTTPWGIVSTDGTGISDFSWLQDTLTHPLLEREFVHGVYDCYAVVRDWYFQNMGVTLINVPRQYDWWNCGQNLYLDNFIAAGFHEITEQEAGIGDSVLMKVLSPVPNHAAVISGNNQITHHLFHRLSETDSLNKWKKCIVKYLRYKNA